MKNKKGISIIVLILVLVVIGIIGTVTTILITSKKENQTNNNIHESENGIQDFIEDVENKGKENSQEKIGKYKIPEKTSFTYEEVEDGIRITGYEGNIMEVEVPSTIGEKM